MNGTLTRLLTAGLLSLVLTVPGCQLTDHHEGGDVGTDDIRFPVTGYEGGEADGFPTISFDSTELSMGRIIQGARVEKRFRFTNAGAKPLVLSAVNSTCGCTVGKDWPREPIKPGGTGEITVTFDSEGRPGVQHKSVTVVSNANPPSTVLTLTGEVVGPSASN